MKKYASLVFLVLLTFLLVAEEGEEYGKDEWENDYNREEKELFIVLQDETQDEKDISDKYVKNNYFTKMYVEGVFNWAKPKHYAGKINSHILAAYYEAFLSYGFDSKTLLPTYNIVVGVPGESHAIEVASLNGLKLSIIEKAKEYLSNNSSNISHLINNLIEKQREVENLKEKLKNDEKKQIEKIEQYADNNDITTISISQYKENLKVDSSTFSFNKNLYKNYLITEL